MNKVSGNIGAVCHLTRWGGHHRSTSHKLLARIGKNHQATEPVPEVPPHRGQLERGRRGRRGRRIVIARGFAKSGRLLRARASGGGDDCQKREEKEPRKGTPGPAQTLCHNKAEMFTLMLNLTNIFVSSGLPRSPRRHSLLHPRVHPG